MILWFTEAKDKHPILGTHNSVGGLACSLLSGPLLRGPLPVAVFY